MSLADDLLPVLFELRGIGGQLGFRPFSIKVVKTTGGDLSTGTRPTIDSMTTLVEGDGYAPACRFLNRNDKIRGAAMAAEIRVGPITPSHVGGGTSLEEIDPSLSKGEQLYYLIDGPGFAVGGSRFVKVSLDSSSPLKYFIDLQRVNDGR